ncbi:MAG: ABC transporter ATP-binding protein [Thermodesulfobacteriota bacterium]
MNNEPLFIARGLTKEFLSPQRLTVLRGIDLTLRQGEMAAVVGTSGTGKTTLLHILGTLDRPSGGTLLHQGRDIFGLDDQQLSSFRNQRIGFVFQFHHLLPEFTALENVMLPGMIAEEPRSELTDRARNLLDRVGLADRTSHKVGELSGGEQQRVAIARALVMKPALLLADEPTGNLDPKTGERVFALMQELNQNLGLATVMVTHNHTLARRMDRCLTLADGLLREGID